MAAEGSGASGVVVNPPPIVGDIAVTITDPIKNDQGVLKSYISYKVNTETNIESLGDKRFSVIRRYSVSLLRVLRYFFELLTSTLSSQPCR